MYILATISQMLGVLAIMHGFFSLSATAEEEKVGHIVLMFRIGLLQVMANALLLLLQTSSVPAETGIPFAVLLLVTAVYAAVTLTSMQKKPIQ